MLFINFFFFYLYFTLFIYLVIKREQGRKFFYRCCLKWHESVICYGKISVYHVIWQGISKKLIYLCFLICISFLLVLDYRLVEGFSLTQSSFDDFEGCRCSLVYCTLKLIIFKHYLFFWGIILLICFRALKSICSLKQF